MLTISMIVSFQFCRLKKNGSDKFQGLPPTRKIIKTPQILGFSAYQIHLTREKENPTQLRM